MSQSDLPSREMEGAVIKFMAVTSDMAAVQMSTVYWLKGAIAVKIISLFTRMKTEAMISKNEASAPFSI